MKLWLLRPKLSLWSDVPRDNPWEPRDDKCFGFVVRAETEEQARKIAAQDALQEKPSAWINSAYSTCVELTSDGNPGLVISDVHWNWA